MEPARAEPSQIFASAETVRVTVPPVLTSKTSITRVASSVQSLALYTTTVILCVSVNEEVV